MNDDQLPSDYGGTNLSIEDILERYAENAHQDHMRNLAELEPDSV